MTTLRACDVCKFYRQNGDGTEAVHRYHLRRDDPGWRNHPPRKQGSRGGIDLCDECWTRIAKPRMRPASRSRINAETAEGRP